jgi:hypothetical protein
MVYSQAFAPLHAFEVSIPLVDQWKIMCFPDVHVLLGHENLMP